MRILPAMALAIGLLSGCAAPPPPEPPPPGDPRLVATPPVRQALHLQILQDGPGPDGRLRVAIDVQNPNPADFPLRYQAEWFDAAARPISTAQSRAQFRSIPRFGATSLTADAPSPAARSFRILLDLDAP